MFRIVSQYAIFVRICSQDFYELSGGDNSQRGRPIGRPGDLSFAALLRGLPSRSSRVRPAFALLGFGAAALLASRAKAGGPAWTRTRNQTVMSGRL
jgi:hypothetical protein